LLTDSKAGASKQESKKEKNRPNYTSDGWDELLRAVFYARKIPLPRFEILRFYQKKKEKNRKKKRTVTRPSTSMCLESIPLKRAKKNEKQEKMKIPFHTTANFSVQ